MAFFKNSSPMPLKYLKINRTVKKGVFMESCKLKNTYNQFIQTITK